MKRSDQIKASLRRRKKKVESSLYLSTGSTMLNLACTGKADRGFRTGKYVFFVGDSNSGKTFIGLTCFAEAANDPAFDEHRLIYVGTEGGAIMDFRRFFGRKMAERVELFHCLTVEEFYNIVDDVLKDDRPFILVLDSQDALSSEAEEKKFQQRKRKARKVESGEDDGKSTGSFGDNKAKVHSANIRRVIGRLEGTKSLLIVLNQTRDSFSMFENATYSGGRALKFYATLQLWSSTAEQIKKTVRGKQRQLGIVAKVQVKKNRETGRDRTVRVPIYHSIGIDDVGGCVDFLVFEKVWKASERGKGPITAVGLGPQIKLPREKLVRMIEERGMEQDLRDLVVQTWQEIEEACEIERKARYE